jgi:ribosomal protein L13E
MFTVGGVRHAGLAAAVASLHVDNARTVNPEHLQHAVEELRL